VKYDAASETIAVRFERVEELGEARKWFLSLLETSRPFLSMWKNVYRNRTNTRLLRIYSENAGEMDIWKSIERRVNTYLHITRNNERLLHEKERK
jgi:hypothetical protein